MARIKSLCVYCGSSPGRQPIYLETAQLLADALVSREIQLIYGGASIGIMGSLADGVLQRGGRVIGVIPQALAHQEVMHSGLSELHITHSMHERKLKMAELADGFIALPGGIGTLEELFEIWTWSQLRFHQKPIALLNIAGYYDPLLSFLDHIQTEQFFKPQHRALLNVDTDIERLLNTMSAQYQSVIETDILGNSDLL
ncbi:MAG: TIGR00730 family Rossman fold protein [Methylococcaceae bacterium]|nr:TIGR00730 family Rossman fold protein [Methylococcaceae bacterium]